LALKTNFFLMDVDDRMVDLGTITPYEEHTTPSRTRTVITSFRLRDSPVKGSRGCQRESFEKAADVKKPHERPSIGVLCATKDDEVMEYALARTTSPTLVAEYQTYLPPKEHLRAKPLSAKESETDLVDRSEERPSGGRH